MILPGPGVAEERTREAEGVVLAVMTARQMRAAAVLGRLVEQEPICWKMACENWVAGAASSLSVEVDPLMKLMRLAVEPRWQPSF